MFYLLLIFLPIYIFLINLFFKRNKFAPNYSGDNHQKYIKEKSIPLSGGMILVSLLLVLFFDNHSIFSIALLAIFFIGFISDLNLLSSPRHRFILQAMIIFIFVYFINLNVGPTRIFFLDFFLENILFSFLFTTFCLMIVVNGSNFIDGLNGILLGYYLIILGIIFNLSIFWEININYHEIIFLITLMVFLLIFNFSNKLYMGDGGAYTLGFTVSYFLITYYQNNQNISPFFIILLLWYPCFENLFSIIRKFRFHKSPLKSDVKHFHQLLFFFIAKKFKCKNFYANNISSLIILFYNLLVFTIASQKIHDSKFQIILVLANIVVYILVYFRLFNFKYSLKSI